MIQPKTDSQSEFDAMVFNAAELIIDRCMPDGVALDPHTRWTDGAFDFYIAKHGRPDTANAARRMFEFAAVLSLSASYHSARRKS